MNKKGNSLKEAKLAGLILVCIILVTSGYLIIRQCIFSYADDTTTNSVSENATESISNQINTDQNQLYSEAKTNSEDVVINTGVQLSSINSGYGWINPMENDYRVIPDKYNTGCKGDLIKVTGEFSADGIILKESGGNLVFDFYYRNKEASGTYILEDYDFSDFGIAFNSEKKVSGKKINIVFNNCKFSAITTMRPASDVFTYTYNNCTIKKFNGSNSSFNNCRFGDSYSDCIVPFNNISVKDCYFANLASNDPIGNGKHSDGTQMYGYSDAMVQNILFSHCRFEIPAVDFSRTTSAVNACVMLSLEYNNAKNIIIEDSILNGGGYTIYAGKKKSNLTMSDICFRNIKIGDAKLFGNIYPSVDENVVFENVEDQDSLYVSSVWNDGVKTHIIVSNDTSIERVLKVVTGRSSRNYVIKPCLGGRTLRYDYKDIPFEDFPFDLEITIDSIPDYVICFDVTDGYEKQIRYVSFNGKPTYYEIKPNQQRKSESDTNNEVVTSIVEGSCGDNVTYSLDSFGVLKIEGSGAMYDYHSQKTPPWTEYSDRIIEIMISEGITKIGTQSFRKLKNIEKIDLPRSLKAINSNAFSGCSGLKYLSFYSGLKRISRYAFNGVKLVSCTYYGTEEEWNTISIEENNDTLSSCTKYIQKPVD